MTRPFHLGWFCNFTAGEWNAAFAPTQSPWDGKFYVEMAQALERACFDYIMLEDTLMVSEAWRGTAEGTLKWALQAPKHDPLPLAAMIGSNTTRLGVVATMSTMAYPPFMLARLATTLDHICGGRFGWNIVTTGEDTAAQNFGMEKLPEREDRYAMAEEYVELVTQLFASWDRDAVVVMDRERGVYADHTKVRPIDFKGNYFSCRGPLNTVPSPQGKPVFLQAGGSPRGRGFAAKVADSIIAVANGAEGMKAYRDDVRARAKAAGRDPDSIKVMFLVYPVIGVTAEEAEAKHRRMVEAPGFIEAGLAMTGTVTDIDFSTYDLDQPLPHKLTTNGEQGSLDKFQQWGSGKTLRQLASERYDGGLRLVGTPEAVARTMGEAMEAIGGDGFLISTPFQLSSRQRILEITEGLVPALQRQGLARTAYRGTTLREVLTEF